MKNAGLWGGLGFLIFGIIIFSQSLKLEYYTKLGPGPGFFPLWLSGALILVTLLYFWESYQKDIISVADVLPEKEAWFNILIAVASLIFFALTLNDLGFILSGSLMFFFMLFRAYKWYSALIISVITNIILFVVFNTLLSVTLPTNMFGW